MPGTNQRTRFQRCERPFFQRPRRRGIPPPVRRAGNRRAGGCRKVLPQEPAPVSRGDGPPGAKGGRRLLPDGSGASPPSSCARSPTRSWPPTFTTCAASPSPCSSERPTLLRPADLPWLIDIVRATANWAHVDWLATKVVGPLVAALPAARRDSQLAALGPGPAPVGAADGPARPARCPAGGRGRLRPLRRHRRALAARKRSSSSARRSAGSCARCPSAAPSSRSLF